MKLTVKLHDTETKSFEIADWFHTYFSHTVQDEKQREELAKKATLDGYFEDGDKIYVLY